MASIENVPVDPCPDVLNSPLNAAPYMSSGIYLRSPARRSLSEALNSVPHKNAGSLAARSYAASQKTLTPLMQKAASEDIFPPAYVAATCPDLVSQVMFPTGMISAY